MIQKIIQISRVITLLCYSVYALSPIYCAVHPASNNVHGQEGASQHHAELGILWLNIVFDSFDDGDWTDNPAHGDQHFQTSQDGDIVLVKKKRVVNRKNNLVQPLLKARTVAIVEIKPPLAVASMYEIPRDLIHHYADGYSSLSTGLSPPSFIS